ncbi:hypothetical protein [Azospirillum sp. sgz301742]
MSIQIASGSSSLPTTPQTSAKPAATATAAPSTSTATTAAAPTDQVVLSPQAKELKAILALKSPAAAAPVQKTPAELKAEEVFMDAVKKFFVDRLGLDPLKATKVTINKEALHYIMRNTVLGALAPPSMVREMGADFAKRPPENNGTLAEVTVEGRKNEPALARVVFDPAAMEKLAHLPKKKKDRDGDGMFSHLDLMPSTRVLPPGKQIDNDYRFDGADKRFAKDDLTMPKPVGPDARRIMLTDGRNHPFFMTRLRGDVESPKEATANMAFSLLQFAGLSPS